MRGSTMTARAATLPRVVRTVPALRRAIAAFRSDEETVALVPTMGALHAGHFALVRGAKRRARRTVVSIFVNPTQFAPHEDFRSYPRTLKRDVAALTDLGIDLVWAPGVDEMYPDGFATRIDPAGPAKVGLEDAFRPHFFSGVATVVAKLLIQALPDYVMFGEKDFQQLKVVTRMVRDLDLPIRVVAVPTVRESDGLALSSRNIRLSAEQRIVAPTLYKVMKECAVAIRSGQPTHRVLPAGRRTIEQAGFQLDYLEARHAGTLQPINGNKREPIRLLVAARLGNVRLIDNLRV
jgi:pantoate--beta-alanine ligase